MFGAPSLPITARVKSARDRDQHIRQRLCRNRLCRPQKLLGGRTADHVIIHADSRASNLVDQKSFYVGISRAKASVAVYTNDRAKLVSAISERVGVTQTAVAQAMVAGPKGAKVMGARLGK